MGCGLGRRQRRGLQCSIQEARSTRPTPPWASSGSATPCSVAACLIVRRRAFTAAHCVSHRGEGLTRDPGSRAMRTSSRRSGFTFTPSMRRSSPGLHRGLETSAPRRRPTSACSISGADREHRPCSDSRQRSRHRRDRSYRRRLRHLPRTASTSTRAPVSTSIRRSIGPARDRGDLRDRDRRLETRAGALVGGRIAGVTSCHDDGDWPEHRVEHYARIDVARAWLEAELSRPGPGLRPWSSLMDIVEGAGDEVPAPLALVPREAEHHPVLAVEARRAEVAGDEEVLPRTPRAGRRCARRRARTSLCAGRRARSRPCPRPWPSRSCLRAPAIPTTTSAFFGSASAESASGGPRSARRWLPTQSRRRRSRRSTRSASLRAGSARTFAPWSSTSAPSSPAA